VAVEESQQFCAQCQRFVLARRPGTNHIFHLLMCVFTCGLWVIIWFLSSAKVGGWRCSVCGGMQFGQAYGSPQVAGVAAVKSGPPRALMLLGAGIGGFFALVLLIGMCSAAGRRQAERNATVAESEARMRDNAAAAAKPAWQAQPDVVALAEIFAGKVTPLGVDKTGDTLQISRFSVPSWPTAELAMAKKSPGAWSMHLEGTDCSADRWAPKVVLIEDEGDKPLSTQWYRLEGGPLNGLLVMAQTKSQPCMWNIATTDYAVFRGWKHKR
jgi:hypothetical protein